MLNEHRGRFQKVVNVETMYFVICSGPTEAQLSTGNVPGWPCGFSLSEYACSSVSQYNKRFCLRSVLVPSKLLIPLTPHFCPLLTRLDLCPLTNLPRC